MIRKITTVCALIVLVFINTVAAAYGSFDFLNKKIIENLTIGKWLTLSPLEYLNSNDFFKQNQSGNIIDIRKIIAEKIWQSVSVAPNGKIRVGEIKGEFSEHNGNELIQAIDEIYNFIDNFLNLSPENNLKYPETATAPQIIASEIELVQGEFIDIYKIALSADQTYGYWTPITIDFYISGAGDLSDYSLEIIYKLPERIENAFAYQYRIVDTAFYNQTVASGDIIKTENIPVYIQGGYSYSVNTVNYSNQTQYTSAQITHNLLKPDFSGEWSRFVTGAKLAIGTKATNKLSELEQPLLSEGIESHLLLNGKPNAKEGQLRLCLYQRGSWDKDSFDLIQLMLRLSRGISTEISQKSSRINIKMSARAGDVWS